MLVGEDILDDTDIVEQKKEDDNPKAPLVLEILKYFRELQICY